MIGRMMVAMLAAFAAISPACAAPQTANERMSIAGEGQIQAFLTTLKAGRQRDAVQTLMSSSPLWSKHPGFSEQMVGQIDAAVQAYGLVVAYEKLSSVDLGTMVRREYYLVQHHDMVVRWEFDLVRTANGWNVGYFGFSDQPTTWFS